MIAKLTSLHWWLFGVNPVKQFGWLPTLIWAVPIICAFLYFFPFEYVGVKRLWGCVPLTWFVQCCPPAVLAAALFISLDHFILHNKILGPVWSGIFRR